MSITAIAPGPNDVLSCHRLCQCRSERSHPPPRYPSMESGTDRIRRTRLQEAESIETYISAEQPPAFTPSRVPSSHGRQGGAGHHPQAPPEGSEQAERLMRSIRRAGDFERLRRAGRTARVGALRIRALPDDVEGPHVAFAIGRSYGNAVERNRIRRRLRGLITILDRDGALAAGWYLFSVDPGADSLSSSELDLVMRSALSKLSGL